MPSQRPQTLVLKKDLARSIRRGHPWLYRDALQTRGDLTDGELVEVHTRDGRPLARGFWDSRSAIALRLLQSGGPDFRFDEPERLLEARLRAALDKRLEQLDFEKTNAFRWVHGEADLLPGLHLDCYADVLVARFDGDGARAFYADLEGRLRQAAGDRLPFRRLVDRDGNGAQAAEGIEVLENGVRFIVRPGQGQKGGLFLDQRENRQRVAARAAGKTLLNLFGYTGGFAVQAAVAGASRTDTIDIAKPAIEAARRNFEANGVAEQESGLYAEDVFEFLPAAINRGDRWDIVVSDPPSFAAKKESAPAARKAYRRLHGMAAAVTAEGGLLCAASCSTQVGEEDFLASIEAGVRDAGRRWRLRETYGAALDHPSLEAFPQGDYLKFAIGTVFG